MKAEDHYYRQGWVCLIHQRGKEEKVGLSVPQSWASSLLKLEENVGEPLLQEVEVMYPLIPWYALHNSSDT